MTRWTDKGSSPLVMRGPLRTGDWVEIIVLVLIGYTCFLYYNVVGHISSLQGVDFGPYLLTRFDLAIPYIPFWVLFYQMAFFMPGIIVLLILWKPGLTVAATRRIFFSFLAMLCFHYALYVMVPTSARAIRVAEEALGGGLFGSLVRYQYRLSSAWCSWPALHVSNCWFFYHLLARHYRFLGWAYLTWFLGMFVGTVAIKTHYLLDGVAGIAFAELAYRLLLLRLERVEACQWEWRSEALRALCHLAILALLIFGISLAMRASGLEGPLYTIAAKLP